MADASRPGWGFTLGLWDSDDLAAGEDPSSRRQYGWGAASMARPVLDRSTNRVVGIVMTQTAIPLRPDRHPIPGKRSMRAD